MVSSTLLGMSQFRNTEFREITTFIISNVLSLFVWEDMLQGYELHSSQGLTVLVHGKNVLTRMNSGSAQANLLVCVAVISNPRMWRCLRPMADYLFPQWLSTTVAVISCPFQDQIQLF